MSTGIDIVKNNRIKKILESKRDSFYRRVFTENEISHIISKNHDYRTVSGLFAAKEAISKVVGTGIGVLGWKDMEISHLDNGKPYVKINEKLISLLKPQNLNAIELSISHEDDYSIAFAIGHKKDTYKIPIEIKKLLAKRNVDTHKGSYGRVGIIGGQKGMAGSIYLAASASLRCGSGLVYSIVGKDIEETMWNKCIEIIVRTADNKEGYLNAIQDLDGINLGPGFGTEDNKKSIVKSIITNYPGPIVLDADGINCIADEPEILLKRKSTTIITPHPGELARLLGKSVNDIQNNRIHYSKYTSDKYNVITVLKGYKTIVASQGQVYINDTGNPGMATAGSGDILGGMIISFICQGKDPFNSCVIATYSHGLAGDLAKDKMGEYGLIARDILEQIPKSLRIIQE